MLFYFQQTRWEYSLLPLKEISGDRIPALTPFLFFHISTNNLTSLLKYPWTLEAGQTTPLESPNDGQ